MGRAKIQVVPDLWSLMRGFLMGTLLLAAMALPAHAQTARVTVIAHLRIPDIMVVTPGATESPQIQGSDMVQRVTVYVSANRGWALMVRPGCTSNCDNVSWRVIPAGQIQPFSKMTTAPVTTGVAVNKMPVVIEFRWARNSAAPDLERLAYSLAVD